MTVTRRTFERVADVLAGERAIAIHDKDEARRMTVSAITYSIADVFAQENPRFDRDKFYARAGQTG